MQNQDITKAISLLNRQREPLLRIVNSATDYDGLKYLAASAKLQGLNLATRQLENMRGA